MSKQIYLDNAATTPLDPRVLSAMMPYLKSEFGNPSSLHQFGDRARQAVERAGAQIADFLGCRREEVYFTSGATESDNLAVLGLIRAVQKGRESRNLHLISSQIEHDAVLEPLRELERQGAKLTLLRPKKSGLIDLADLKKAVRKETILISLMYVNNEIGTIQPIEAVGRFLQEENGKRQARGLPRIYFHTDAAQAPNYCDCRVDKLAVDLMSLSAHKIYGPKGVGVLYLRRGTPLSPLFFGGHQQNNLRPGTLAPALIVGLGEAVAILNKKSRNQEIKKIRKIRDYLIEEIKRKIPGTMINGDLIKRTPNNINFIFKGAEGESIILLLAQKGLAVSTGSACSSGSLEPSHVLLAIGVKPESAHGSLRVTLGRFNTEADARRLIEELPLAVARLRKMAPKLTVGS